MSTWRGTKPDTRPRLSLTRNPITDMLGVTSQAASDVAKTTAGIGLNTLDAATGNTLSKSGADKAELAGLMGFLMNPGKGANVMSKLFNWYKAAPISRGLGTVGAYEFGTGELEDLTGQNIWQMTETNRDKEARIESERAELENKRREDDQRFMDEYGIITQEEARNMNNPLLEINPLSPTDSLHWARNW